MGMGEIEKMNRGESRVSGSYIRHLVKHLSNSSREPTNSKVSNGDGTYKNLEGFDKNQPPQSQRRTREATPQKKRVRRRLNTTKPYQERLLNMAEARREIVAALKYHRETMKKEQEQKQIQEQQIKSLESIDVVKSERNSKNQNTNRDLPFSRFSSHVAPHPFVFSYPWNSPQIVPAPSSIEDLNLILPPKTLGLNLNLDSFENLETIPYSNKISSGSSIYTSSSLSPLSSSSPSSPIIVELPCITSSAISTPSKSNSTEPSSSTGMIHSEVGSQDVGEIRSIEEQDGVEWNDTLNLESSDWWLNVLNPTELDTDNNHNGNDKDVLHLFDDSLEICGENCFSLSHVHHCCHPDQLLEEASLPCLNIWDIEEMGDIWLS